VVQRILPALPLGKYGEVDINDLADDEKDFLLHGKKIFLTTGGKAVQCTLFFHTI
jgi:hypothetical protein